MNIKLLKSLVKTINDIFDNGNSEKTLQWSDQNLHFMKNVSYIDSWKWKIQERKLLLIH